MIFSKKFIDTFLRAITFCANIESENSKFEVLISAIIDKIMTFIYKKANVVNNCEICFRPQN